MSACAQILFGELVIGNIHIQYLCIHFTGNTSVCAVNTVCVTTLDFTQLIVLISIVVNEHNYFEHHITYSTGLLHTCV